MTENEATKKKKSKKGIILRGVIIALSGILLGLNIFFINANSLASNSMPMPFGVGASVVLTGSMEPTLGVNDLIVVKKADSFAVGDIVVYQTHGISVVHRIKSIDGETVVTRGDANNADDDPINLGDIKGKLVFSLPFAGLIIKFLRSPVGIIIIVALAVLLLELSFKKEKSKDNDELDAIKEEIRRLKDEQNK